jgi:hypothetical protein
MVLPGCADRRALDEIGRSSGYIGLTFRVLLPPALRERCYRGLACRLTQPRDRQPLHPPNLAPPMQHDHARVVGRGLAASALPAQAQTLQVPGHFPASAAKFLSRRSQGARVTTLRSRRIESLRRVTQRASYQRGGSTRNAPLSRFAHPRLQAAHGTRSGRRTLLSAGLRSCSTGDSPADCPSGGRAPFFSARSKKGPRWAAGPSPFHT